MDEPLCTRYQHRKTAGKYRVLATGHLQVSSPADLDMAEVVIYQSEKDRRIWVRPKTEFLDGRFFAIGDAAP